MENIKKSLHWLFGNPEGHMFLLVVCLIVTVVGIPLKVPGSEPAAVALWPIVLAKLK